MLEPNRNYVIEDDGSIHKMLFSGDADWEEKATTSIKEIRNKAIDDFADKMIIMMPGHKRDILQIAEQLKKGGIDAESI